MLMEQKRLIDVNLGKQNIAIFLGPEENGLSKEVKNKLDIVCRIEMTKDMEAQWPEQPTCNRQVRGSTPLSGSEWLSI